MTYSLKAQGLCKIRSGFRLGPLDIALEAGLVAGFVGPNGAGKTTTMDVLAGLMEPDGGYIEAFGQRVSASDVVWRQQLGYVSEHQPFFERWTGARNLRFLSDFYPSWSDSTASTLVRRLGFPLDKKVKTLSRGNRVKLMLVAALAHRPKLLLLDEPTAGLDPVVRAEFQEVMWEVLESGEQAVLYSTHILSDINDLADEVLFIRNGQIVLKSDKDLLADAWRQITARFPSSSSEQALLSGLGEGATVQRRVGNEVLILTPDEPTTLARLRGMGAEVRAVTRVRIDDIAVQILKGDAYVEHH